MLVNCTFPVRERLVAVAIRVVCWFGQAELGAAANTKRPTSCVLISPKADFSYQSKFDKAVKEVIAITPVF